MWCKPQFHYDSDFTCDEVQLTQQRIHREEDNRHLHQHHHHHQLQRETKSSSSVLKQMNQQQPPSPPSPSPSKCSKYFLTTFTAATYVSVIMRLTLQVFLVASLMSLVSCQTGRLNYVSAVLGSTAELACNIPYDAKSTNLELMWIFNHSPVRESNRVTILPDGTLRIEQVRNTDVGMYECNIQFPSHTVSRKSKLDVIELPHAPLNVKTELNVAGGLVNVSWTPPFDGNSPIVRYIIEKRVVKGGGDSALDEVTFSDALNGWTRYSANISATQRFSLLTNLAPAMTYQFRVLAVNSVGEGPPSSPSNPPITLPAQPPSAPPIGLVGGARSSTSIIIQWQPPPPDSHNGVLYGYIVRYKLAGYKDTMWYHKNVTNSVHQSCLLEDLIVWRNYEIQVAAYNEMGTGTYSPAIFITTKEGKPSAAPPNVKAKALNSTAILVTWNQTDPQLMNGLNQGYRVTAYTYDSWKQSKKFFKEIIATPAPIQSQGQEVIFTDLPPYTEFIITVSCFTSAGDGPVNEPPIHLKTLEDLPGPVSSLKFGEVKDTSINLSWSLPEKVNGELLEFTLKYCEVGSIGTSDVSASSSLSSTSSKSDSHVTSVNHFQSTSSTGSTSSSSSSSSSSVSSSSSKSDHTSNDATCAWKNLNYSSHVRETMITGLKPDTTYKFQINAVTRIGAGPIVSASVKSAVAPVEIGELKFSDITMTRFKMSWAPPVIPANSNQTLIGYQVIYETLNEYGKQVKQRIVDNFLVVTGLKERATYIVKVRAETLTGLGPERVGNITTGPQVGSPEPLLSVNLTQTITSVKLKWMNPVHSTEPILGYLIEGKQVYTIDHNVNSLNSISNLHSNRHVITEEESSWQPIVTLRNGLQSEYDLSFSHLSPSSKYSLRVSSFNSKGISEPVIPNIIQPGMRNDTILKSNFIITPSHLAQLRARMPFYKESWFVILCASITVVFTIMVTAILCVQSKSYANSKNAPLNSKNNGYNGSGAGLSDMEFGLDDVPYGNSGMDLQIPNGHHQSNHQLSVGVNPTGTLGRRPHSSAATHRRSNMTINNEATIAAAAAMRSPPRPAPGSLSYSDDDMCAGGLTDYCDTEAKEGIYGSSGDSLTEKPSEMSSSGPDSDESDDQLDSAGAHFVSHYANVNDTLHKGRSSWKKQGHPYTVRPPVDSHHSHHRSNHHNRDRRAGEGTSRQYNLNASSNSVAGGVTSSNVGANGRPSRPVPPVPSRHDTMMYHPTNGSNHGLTSVGTSMPGPGGVGVGGGVAGSSSGSSTASTTTGLLSSNHHHTSSSGQPPPSYLSAVHHNRGGNTSSQQQQQQVAYSSVQNYPPQQQQQQQQQQTSHHQQVYHQSSSNNYNGSGTHVNNNNNELDGDFDCPSVNLNGGRVIVNNMPGSRAPLPGFSSFV